MVCSANLGFDFAVIKPNPIPNRKISQKDIVKTQFRDDKESVLVIGTNYSAYLEC